MIRFVLLFLLWPLVAVADPFPALFNVTGVAANDTLNVRAQPNGSAEKRGALTHDAENIEVTATNDAGTWGRVNLGESSGWVSMRYLARHEDNPDYALAHALTCFGTEPFWSADITQGQGVTIRTPETQIDIPGAGLIVPASGRMDLFALGFVNSSAQVRRAECTDGMSDRIFGLQIGLFLRHDQSATLYSGCCSIAMH